MGVTAAESGGGFWWVLDVEYKGIDRWVIDV